MKKIIMVMLALTTALMFSCNPVAHGQAGIPMYRNTDTTSAGVATTATITTGTTDTLYDANTLYTMYTRPGALSGATTANYLCTFTVTKISGTGTAKVFLQGSADGVTWRNVNASMLGTDGYSSDTLNIAAASTTALGYAYYSTNGRGVYRPTLSSAVYYVVSGRYFYFRLKIVGAGTQQTIYGNAKIYTYTN